MYYSKYDNIYLYGGKMKVFKRMFKGFTLIELLAVIIILAIIALIAVPRIMIAIENARLNSAKNSVYAIVRAGEILYAEREGSDDPLPRNTNILEQIEFSGKRPSSGEVIVSEDGVVKAALVFQDKCFIKLDEDVEKIDEFTECVVPEGGGLPENADIAYIYDMDNIAVNATACLIDGQAFTHIEDKRESKIYSVTLVEEQCWFAENLTYTDNGNLNCLSNTWNSSSPFNACDTHSADHGPEVLYQWEAAMDGSTQEGSKGICPEGWIIPTDDEWKELEMSLGMSEADANSAGFRGTDEAEQLKVEPPLFDGTNTVGFNSRTTGYRHSSGSLFSVVSDNIWWSSSSIENRAWSRGVYWGLNDIFRSDDSQAWGYSVRCLLE